MPSPSDPVNTSRAGSSLPRVERVYLDTRLVARNRWIDLEHMRAEDCLMPPAQVERIVLHKYRTVVVRHNLEKT